MEVDVEMVVYGKPLIQWLTMFLFVSGNTLYLLGIIEDAIKKYDDSTRLKVFWNTTVAVSGVWVTYSGAAAIYNATFQG